MKLKIMNNLVTVSLTGQLFSICIKKIKIYNVKTITTFNVVDIFGHAIIIICTYTYYKNVGNRNTTRNKKN